jgi:hypothetical protein
MKSSKAFLALVLSLSVVSGTVVISGCDTETGSAPKMKGTKDEIQKATQSGTPGKAGRPGTKKPG